ncbi:MAG TPA: Asp-tRNA(Asn)/Glu-tRNA(Gln) amidotransferase subunit GatB, partial [Burkholderiales bacterium]|nr:Asp-tRNA(Asn)/Glu-tRNA(Gln) amidotransferase subunit GatB [Burkholderiales bacterium]
ETHVQLSTRSKIFSGASADFGAEPNVNASAVDVALPGVLPVLNRGAVERAIKFGLAVGGRINPHSVFARKNYFYPDLPKGYQISQYDRPIVEGGTISITAGEREKTVRLTRAHLEEDAGKSLHENFHGVSGIDLNRAGTPLLEIVSEPDMRGAQEAVACAHALHSLVRYLDICDGNMQKGNFRCDANVSVRPVGEERLGTRCEIKNLNSFRFLERAIEYEAARQIELLTGGGRIEQETRLFDPERNETRGMRSKEEAHDYRYFPDPDLLPLALSQEWLDEIAATLPELPGAKRARYTAEFGLSTYDAGILTASRDMALYFEDLVRQLREHPKLCANWVIGELGARLNRDELEAAQSPISSERLAALLRRIADGTVSGKIAKEIFDAMWRGEGDADAIIESRGLKQVSDFAQLEAIVDEILAKHPAQIAEYRNGKGKALNFLVGQAMKATRGQANPTRLNEILKRKLA